MQLIHAYLNRTYEIRYHPLPHSCDVIYHKNSDLLTYPEDLLSDITDIFAIEDPIAKKYVKEWSSTLKPKTKLSSYWKIEKPNSQFIMPLIQRIAARTIGMDLVAVKPLELPKGLHNFMDYISSSGDTTPNKNGRIYNGEIMSEQINQLYQNQANVIINDDIRRYGELGHFTNRIYGVSSRKKED